MFVKPWTLKFGGTEYTPRQIHTIFYGRSHLVFGWSEADRKQTLPWDHLPDLLADVAYRQDRQAECIELLKKILENDETTLHRLWRYGDALQEAGQTDQAYQTWRRAIALGPETDGKGLYVKLSQYHADRGEQPQADRFKARYYHASGVGLLRGDDPVKARASLEESVRLYDEDPDAWFYLGETRQRLNDRPAARDAYERCLALRPEHGRARRALGQFGRVVRPD